MLAARIGLRCALCVSTLKCIIGTQILYFCFTAFSSEYFISRAKKGTHLFLIEEVDVLAVHAHEPGSLYF